MDERYLEWLRSLPGVTAARARRLAERFPTFELLRAATRDELASIDGLASSDVDSILRTLGSADGRDASGPLFRCPSCGSFLGPGSSSCSGCGASSAPSQEGGTADPLSALLRDEASGVLCVGCGAIMSREERRCPICSRTYTDAEVDLLPSRAAGFEASTRLCPRCGAYLFPGSEACAICGRGPEAAPRPDVNGHHGLGQGFLERWQKVAEVAPKTEMERLQEELDRYDRLVGTDPTLERAWANRGRVLAKMGRAVDAAESLAKAAELDPSKEETYRLEVLDILHAKGDMSFLPPRWREPAATSAPPAIEPKLLEALRHYDRLLEADPNLDVAWRTKGEILERIGRSREAEDAFARAETLERRKGESVRTGVEGLRTRLDVGSLDAAPGGPKARLGGPVRGRTNGRVNGMGSGRVNGLTNGAVNGLRQAQGATNGLSGWTGGEGRTNGLVNGNGFTNGRRGRYTPRSLPAQPHWARSLAGIAAVVALLVLVPILGTLFAPPPAPSSAIQINGSFGDWATYAAYVNAPPASFANPDINLLEIKVTADASNLYVYAKVQGILFLAPWTNGTESILVFVDEDNNSATGYPVGGLGADALAVVTGWDGKLQETSRYSFNETGLPSSNDFRRFVPSGSVLAAAAGQQVELKIPVTGEPSLARVLVYGVDNQGNRDAMVGVVQPARPTVVIAQTALAADIVRSSQVSFLRVDLSSIGGSAFLTGLNLTRLGDSRDPASVALYLDDGRGVYNASERLLGQAALGAGLTHLPFNLSLASPATLWAVVSWSAMTPASTFGIQAEEVTGSGTTSLRPPDTKLVYLVNPPPTPVVDGAFGDWNGRPYGQDLVGDVVNGTGSLVYDSNVDLTAVAVDVGANFTGFAQVDGRMLGGEDIPNDIPRPSPPVPPSGNISNATPPYVPQDGYDVLYAYIDADNSSFTGLPVSLGNRSFGFDYAIAILGRNGVVSGSALYRYAPSNGTVWVPIGPVRAGLDAHRIEFATNASAIALTPSYRVVFYASDWRDQYDVALPDAFVATFSLGTAAIADHVVINEVNPSSHPEWVEVANPTDGTVNLWGWVLVTYHGRNTKVVYTFGHVVLGPFGSGSEYYVAILQGNALPNGKSTVGLYAGSALVDETTYNASTGGSRTWARYKDPMTGQPVDSGNDLADFYVSTSPTPGGPNDRYRPTMTLVKTVSAATAVPGMYLTYTLAYNNTGALSKVAWINDTLPAGVTFVSSSLPPASVSGSTLRWIITNTLPNSNHVLTVTVQVNGNGPDGSLQTNVASLTYTDQLRQVMGTVQAWANFTVQRPLITVAKTVSPANAVPGQTVTYTIYYNNTGSANAGTVSIVDRLPSGLVVVSSSPAPTATKGSSMYWNFTNVAPGAHAIVLTAQVVSTFNGTQLVNWAFLNYTGANGYALAGSQASTIVAVPELSDFAFVMAVPLLILALRRRARRKAARAAAALSEACPSAPQTAPDAPGKEEGVADSVPWTGGR